MQKTLLINAMVTLCIVIICVYIVVRAILLGYSDYTGFNKGAAIVLLVSEIFILIHTVGYLLNIVYSYGSKKLQEKLQTIAHKKIEKEPRVAVVVAARHEPKAVLSETLIALVNMNYQNKKIYFLDDSSEESYQKEAESLTKALGIELYRREERHGAKAGIVNDFLKTLHDCTYVAIFDADQCPVPDFLDRVVPILESDKKIAFVQTPQFYINTDESRVAAAATVQQAVFYEYICEGKSSQDAMFCCGTNVIFRKKALDSVGGLDESTVTEDFATSFKLHQDGWKSYYYNHACAFGKGPSNLVSYFKQQHRWANGTISVLKRVVSSFVRHPLSLTIRQWWEYFLSGSYYLVGLAFFTLITFPILFLLFNVTAFFATPEMYLLIFFPYIVLSLVIFYSLLYERKYGFSNLFIGQMLIQISFPVHIKAAFSSLLGIKVSFGVTEKGRGSSISYRRLWPQIIVLLLGYVACVWGINRFIYERDPALLINCFWAAYHSCVMASIFYFNEEVRSSYTV